MINYHSLSTIWHPKPDCRFEHIGSSLPVLVGEYVSFPSETDRYRLLAQCMIYLRIAEASGVTVRCGEANRPVVLAFYIPKDLQTEIYLMTPQANQEVAALHRTVDFKTPLGRCQLLLAFHRFLGVQVPLLEPQRSALRRLFNLDLPDLCSQTAAADEERKRKRESDDVGRDSDRNMPPSIEGVARSSGLNIQYVQAMRNV